MNELPSIAVQMILGSMVTAIAFFLSKTFAKVDTSKEEINKIREDLGLMKASDKKQWENLDDQKDLNQELLKKIQEIRERIIFMEAKNSNDD